jgi:hypothetical protein
MAGSWLVAVFLTNNFLAFRHWGAFSRIFGEDLERVGRHEMADLNR